MASALFHSLTDTTQLPDHHRSAGVATLQFHQAAENQPPTASAFCGHGPRVPETPFRSGDDPPRTERRARTAYAPYSYRDAFPRNVFSDFPVPTLFFSRSYATTLMRHPSRLRARDRTSHSYEVPAATGLHERP